MEKWALHTMGLELTGNMEKTALAVVVKFFGFFPFSFFFKHLVKGF